MTKFYNNDVCIICYRAQSVTVTTMTSAEATGQEYYYGNRQIDNSPRGFGYHRGRGQPTLLQPVTDRTYRDVTNRDSDVEWHHHRGGPQRPAGSVDVFVPQKRSDVATVSRDWTPIVRGQSSPDDEGRSYRNHYGYYGSTTDADTQRQPLNDDRLEIAVANGSQTTIRGVEANVFLQVTMGEHKITQLLWTFRGFSQRHCSKHLRRRTGIRGFPVLYHENDKVQGGF